MGYPLDLRGRAPRGERLHATQPTAPGKRISTIGALSCQGIETALCFEGTLNGTVFLFFIRKFLIPRLKKGHVVVPDNASPHHDENVVPLIEAAGARVVYLPPCSPHLNPIENA